jgi:hypothetical protein
MADKAPASAPLQLANWYLRLQRRVFLIEPCNRCFSDNYALGQNDQMLLKHPDGGMTISFRLCAGCVAFNKRNGNNAYVNTRLNIGNATAGIKRKGV